MSSKVSIRDIKEAQQRLGGSIQRSKFDRSYTMSSILGTEVWLKFENLQYTGSFKGRGARNRLLEVREGRGVIAMSAGNHAQGVAHHGALLGLDTTIVMPENTPFVKVLRTRDLGATVELYGADVMESAVRARVIAEERDLEFIHPFDDPTVIAGQGTVGLEMLEDQPDLDIILVAVGGGGLASGVAIAAAAHESDIDVIGVQSERFPSMADLLEARPTSAISGSTIADGIAVTEPGELTSAILADHDVEILVVTERAIESAIAMLLEIEKTVVEGAGAAGIAAMMEYPDIFEGKKVGVVLCGGNIDPRTLAQVTLRGLAAQGRLSRIRVELDDTPGRLSLVSDVVAKASANVVKVDHDGLGSTGARSTILELILDTLDQAHAQRVLEALKEQDLKAELLPW